jgi:hypothetical protein
LICGKEKGKNINKIRIERRFKLMKIEHLIKFVIILFFLFSNAVAADTPSTAKVPSKSAAAYQGTFSGKWSGEIMCNAISGTFSITISAEGIVSGTFSGVQSGTITGSVSASGEISAKGSVGFSDWSGQLSFLKGRLSGSGTWSGYGGDGLWISD